MKHRSPSVEKPVSTPRSKIPSSFDVVEDPLAGDPIVRRDPRPHRSRSCRARRGTARRGRGRGCPRSVENRSSFVPTPFSMCTSTIGRVTRFGRSGAAAPRADAPAATTPSAARHNAAATHKDARPATLVRPRAVTSVPRLDVIAQTLGDDSGAWNQPPSDPSFGPQSGVTCVTRFGGDRFLRTFLGPPGRPPLTERRAPDCSG